MPIRAYLDGQRFDDETTRLMGIAFELALASLRSSPGLEDPLRATLARDIIALAKAGERDPELLCEAALKAISPANPMRGPPPPAELSEAD